MSGPGRPPSRLVGWALASAGFIVVSPLVALGAALLHHAASFTGICGPYAPDISAHPCGFETYVANFFSPFAVMGMLVLTPVVMIAASVLVAAIWGGVFVVRSVRRQYFMNSRQQ